MDMKAMQDLRYKLCKELDEIGKKKDMSPADLDSINKLTGSIKNLEKIMMMEDGGYSQDGEWEAEMRGNYGRGSSYANHGRHYVRAHYSRDGYSGNYSSKDYSRRYSRHSAMDKLQEMMDDAGTEREREAIRRCMDDMR